MPTLAALALLAAAAAAATPEAPLPAPVHADGAALETAIVEAVRAFLRSDAATGKAALDRAEDSCRRVAYDERPAWPRAIVNEDVAMHLALERCREFAARGDIESAVNSLVWVQRTCRDCHDRRDGKLDDAGKKLPLKPVATPVK